jgi:hypothetical protein
MLAEWLADRGIGPYGIAAMAVVTMALVLATGVVPAAVPIREDRLGASRGRPDAPVGTDRAS